MASTALDLSTAKWRRSSHSNATGGDCVELADGYPGVTPVRDSKNAKTGPVLLFRTPAWTTFVASLKA